MSESTPGNMTPNLEHLNSSMEDSNYEESHMFNNFPKRKKFFKNMTEVGQLEESL